MSKSTYIYLNKYANGALYVGSHTWNGDRGVVDKDYHGSSVLASKFGWVPVETVILEDVVQSRKLVAEREWILKYCSEFGVHSLVKKLHPDFGLQFKDGLMLNCHANSCESTLSAAHSKEVRLKALRTAIANGSLSVWIRSGQSEGARSKAHKALRESGHLDCLSALGNSKESRRKAIETQKSTGSFQAKLDKMHSPESYVKSSSKHDYKSVHEKRVDTLRKRGNYHPKRRMVVVYKDGIEVVRGSVNYCCTVLGKSSWGISVNFKLRASDEAEHRGYLFKCISSH